MGFYVLRMHSHNRKIYATPHSEELKKKEEKTQDRTKLNIFGFSDALAPRLSCAVRFST